MTPPWVFRPGYLMSGVQAVVTGVGGRAESRQVRPQVHCSVYSAGRTRTFGFQRTQGQRWLNSEGGARPAQARSSVTSRLCPEILCALCAGPSPPPAVPDLPCSCRSALSRVSCSWNHSGLFKLASFT